LRRLKPCFFNTWISTYTSLGIKAAPRKSSHPLKLVYQFSTAALYQFTSAADNSLPDVDGTEGALAAGQRVAMAARLANLAWDGTPQRH
jgi:hypothetical protein